MRQTSAHVPPRPPLAQPSEWRGPHQSGRRCGWGDPPIPSFALCVQHLPARQLRELSAAAIAWPPTGGRQLTACVPVWRGAGMRRSLGRMRPRVPPARIAEWLGAYDAALVGWTDGTCVCAVCPAAARAQCERWRPQRSQDRPPPADDRPRVCARQGRRCGCSGPLAACAHRPRGQLGGAAWTAMWCIHWGRRHAPRHCAVCAAATSAHCQSWRPLLSRRLPPAAARRCGYLCGWGGRLPSWRRGCE